jgi:hypothetical protein
MGWFLGFLLLVAAAILVTFWVLYLRLRWPYERWRVLHGTEPFRRFEQDLERSYARLQRLVQAGKVDAVRGEQDLRRLAAGHDWVRGWTPSIERYARELRPYGFAWFARRMLVQESLPGPRFPEDLGAAERAAHAREWAARLASPDAASAWIAARQRLDLLAPDRLPFWSAPLQFLLPPQGRPAEGAGAALPGPPPVPAPSSAPGPAPATEAEQRHAAVVAALDEFLLHARVVPARAGAGGVTVDVERHVAAIRSAADAVRAASTPEEERQARRTLGTRRRLLLPFVEAAGHPLVRSSWARVEGALDAM